MNNRIYKITQRKRKPHSSVIISFRNSLVVGFSREAFVVVFFLWRTQFTETSPHILLTLHRVRECHHESLDQTLTDVSQEERDLLYQQFVHCGSGAQLSWTSAAVQVLSLKKGPNLPRRWCVCLPLLPNEDPTVRISPLAVPASIKLSGGPHINTAVVTQASVVLTWWKYRLFLIPHQEMMHPQLYA